MRAYLPLFSLAVEHLYFSGHARPELDFLFTPQSAAVLNNTGLVVKKTANSVSVFYDHLRSEALRLYAADSREPLHFGLKVFSRIPAFEYYTEPSPSKAGHLLHFDTRTTTADASGRLRLHEQASVSESHFLPLTSPLFDELLSPADRLIKPLLTVVIRVADTGTGPSDEQAPIPPARYYITFKARAVVWKYYLLGAIAKRNAYITDMNNETEFESAGETALSDNRTALTFRSKYPMPLRDLSDYRFQLKERGSGGGKVLIPRLPVASAGQLYRETIDGTDVIVSEVYINY